MITFKKIAYILPAVLLLTVNITEAQPTAFTNVTIIDVENGLPQTAMTVILDGERITAVGSVKSTEIPSGATVIDATGKYLTPGLWDMHSHTWNAEDSRNTVFPLEISHGVVGIRNMCGDCRGNSLDCIDRATYEEIEAIKKDIEEGILIGPKIYNASTFLDGKHSKKKEALIIKSPSQAREVVSDHKKKGFDLLKVYEYLDHDVFQALADEAQKVNIDFGGHIPWSVTVKEAVEAGHKSIEHGYGLFEAVSGMEEDFIEERREALKKEKFTSADNQTLLFGPNGQFPRMIDQKEKKVIVIDSLFQELAMTLKENKTWIAPTLTLEALFIRHKEVADHDMMKYIPLDYKIDWENTLQQYTVIDPVHLRDGQIWFDSFKNLIKRLHNEGVGILAGTDCDVKLIVPGYHLHKELEFLVEAGLTPLEALQTATLNAAIYFEREAEMGTVEAGKIADLVLLDANPLEDITNTKKIQAVILNGRYFNRQALDEMLEEAEKAARE